MGCTERQPGQGDSRESSPREAPVVRDAPRCRGGAVVRRCRATCEVEHKQKRGRRNEGRRLSPRHSVTAVFDVLSSPSAMFHEVPTKRTHGYRRKENKKTTQKRGSPFTEMPLQRPAVFSSSVHRGDAV